MALECQGVGWSRFNWRKPLLNGERELMVVLPILAAVEGWPDCRVGLEFSPRGRGGWVGVCTGWIKTS